MRLVSLIYDIIRRWVIILLLCRVIANFIGYLVRVSVYARRRIHCTAFDIR